MLQESLTESREKREKQFNELAMLACQRLITHFIVIGLMGGSCFAVYWVKMYGVDRLKVMCKSSTLFGRNLRKRIKDDKIEFILLNWFLLSDSFYEKISQTELSARIKLN